MMIVVVRHNSMRDEDAKGNINNYFSLLRAGEGGERDGVRRMTVRTLDE